MISDEFGTDGGHKRAAEQHADAQSQFVGGELVRGGGQGNESEIQINALVFSGHKQQRQIHWSDGDETGQRVSKHHVAQVRPVPRVDESRLEIGENAADASDQRTVGIIVVGWLQRGLACGR